MAVSKRCVMCGKADVKLWTLDNQIHVSVTYLCKVCAAPLAAIMDAAGNLPPSQQLPLPERDPEARVVTTRSRREPKRMAPLLGWTPPAPAPTPSKPRAVRLLDLPQALPETDEERLVREARAEGKTWKEITAMLGGTTTHQNVWAKYHERYSAKGPKRLQEAPD